MASASHCSKFCTKCSSVRVQAKLLIYLFFLLLSIYLFFKKKYIQVSQKIICFTFTFTTLFSLKKDLLRRCVFSRGTKEQANDSCPNILIQKANPPFYSLEQSRTNPPILGTSPQSKTNQQIKNALIDKNQCKKT